MATPDTSAEEERHHSPQHEPCSGDKAVITTTLTATLYRPWPLPQTACSHLSPPCPLGACLSLSPVNGDRRQTHTCYSLLTWPGQTETCAVVCLHRTALHANSRDSPLKKPDLRYCYAAESLQLNDGGFRVSKCFSASVTTE